MIKHTLVITLCLTACVPVSPKATRQDLFAAAVPFCRFIAEPRIHVDQESLVHGLYEATPHHGQIFGRDCPNLAVELDGTDAPPDDEVAVSIVRSALREKSYAKVEVVMRGILRARPQTTPCNRESCMRYILEKAQFVAAKQP